MLYYYELYYTQCDFFIYFKILSIFTNLRYLQKDVIKFWVIEVDTIWYKYISR